MDQTTNPPDAARGLRIIHSGLVVGLALAGVMFGVLLRVRGALLADVPIAGAVLAGLALVMLAVAVGVLRPRVPPRRPDQSAESYWLTNDARISSLVLWAIVDAAGLLAWVGYVLSGQIAAAAVALMSIAALIMLRPSRLEDRGAA